MRRRSSGTKNIEEYVFHPGGNSNHYCSTLTYLPPVYAQAQTSDRGKNRLAVFAVKDTLFEADAAEVKELERWYLSSAVQEPVYSVSYKITTDDKLLQKKR